LTITAVAEHSIEAGHNIDFNNITILEKVTGYMNHIVKEAIERRLHPNNFNRDRGFNLSLAWQPVTNMLKQSDEQISKQGQATQALDSAH
jgi:excinuclease UvrABC helicase subunit UvrB